MPTESDDPMVTTDQHLRAIAFLVSACRPDWDEPGIIAALGKIRDDHDTAGLAIRALRATARTDQRTPAIIALNGHHAHLPGEPEPTPVPERYVPEHRPHPGADVAAHYLAQMRATVANRRKETP